jgi:hypothetical protein
MARASRTRFASLLVPLLAVIVGACNADASSSPTTRTSGGQGQAAGGSQSAPARDTFTGSIVSGTGAYSGHHGRVKIYLHPSGSGPQRPVQVVLRGACAAGNGSCTNLTGSLSGTLKRSGRQLADAGEHFTLTGAGRVSPLGHATGRGTVQGTGFIARGHEIMELTLTTAHGSVTVQAMSGRVKGFQSP